MNMDYSDKTDASPWASKSVKSAESVFKKINTDFSDKTDASSWVSISVKSAESVF